MDTFIADLRQKAKIDIYEDKLNKVLIDTGMNGGEGRRADGRDAAGRDASGRMPPGAMHPRCDAAGHVDAGRDAAGSTPAMRPVPPARRRLPRRPSQP